MNTHPLKVLLISAVLFGFSINSHAQLSGKTKSRFVRWFKKAVWTIGVSGTVIDDDGRQFKKLFDVRHSWNSIWIPSKAEAEVALKRGWSVDASFTVSQLKPGKILDAHNKLRPYSANVLAFDACAKYDLNELIGDTKAFAPYLISGFGYTYRGLPAPRQKNGLMWDFGAGFTVWIYKGFGLNAQSMAKFALNRGKNPASNYLQHSIGVFYRFNVVTGYRTPGRLGHRYNLFRN